MFLEDLGSMELQKNRWSNLSLMFFDQAKKLSTQPLLWFQGNESYHSLSLVGRKGTTTIDFTSAGVSLKKDMLSKLPEQAQLHGRERIQTRIKERIKYKPMSWGEVAEKVLKITGELMANGIGDGDRIVIISENKPEWFIADLAIITCGAITVPAYTTYTTNDYLFILNHCKAKGIIVSSRNLAEKIQPIIRDISNVKFIITMEDFEFGNNEIRTIKWKEILEKAHPASALLAEQLLDESPSLTDLEKLSSRRKIACIIYTSGTGGKPKGVMLSHGSILHNCEGASKMLSDLGGRNEAFMSFLPLSHSYEHTAGQFFPISIGASIYYSERIEKLKANMQQAKPTLMATVPRLCESIKTKILSEIEKSNKLKKMLFFRALDLGKKAYKSPEKMSLLDHTENLLLNILVRRKIKKIFGGRLKALVSGGGPLSYELAIFFEALGVKILQGYGQTESGPVISCNPPQANRLGTVGKILDGIDLKIADDGEILVKGELVMQGYWDDPSLTADTIKEGWLHTGDIGKMDEDGYLVITDRKKDIIVTTGGDNISPQKIESLLSSKPEIHQASVYGDRKPYLVCLLTLDEEFLKKWMAKDPGNKSKIEINQNKELKDFFYSIIDEINKSLSQSEKIRRLMLTSEIFSIENGMLTPTMKIKRHKVHDKYKEQLEGLYEAPR